MLFCGRISTAPVRLPPVSDFHHRDHKHLIMDFINDPVGSLPYPVSILARQLFAAGSPRILCDGFEAFQDSSHIFLGKGTKIF